MSAHRSDAGRAWKVVHGPRPMYVVSRQLSASSAGFSATRSIAAWLSPLSATLSASGLVLP